MSHCWEKAKKASGYDPPIGEKALRERIVREKKRGRDHLGDLISETETELDRFRGQQAASEKAAPPAPESKSQPEVEVAPEGYIRDGDSYVREVANDPEFQELQDLMLKRGQAQNKVKGVKFTKKDEARFQELGNKYRGSLFETTDPVNDPVVGVDINGTNIQQSKQGTYYTFENGRVRTGPAFSGATPDTGTVSPYSVEALQDAFELTEEQAIVADAIARALGAVPDYVAKGGVPGSGALQQNADTARHAELEAKHNAGTITPEETAEAERLVEEAARRAGYDVEAWKGYSDQPNRITYPPKKAANQPPENFERLTVLQRQSPFPTFDPGNTEPEVRIAAFFAKDKEVAQRFRDGFGDESGVLGRFFLNLGRTKSFDGKGVEFAANLQFFKSGKPFRDAIRSGEFDSVTLKNTRDEGDVFITLSPDQSKSADPFTGVPLDQRFNPESPSILYQGRGGKPKASFERIAESGKTLLRGLQDPDFTSAVHEFAHVARNNMADILTPEEVKTATEWAGAEKKWTVRAEERWARAWERYFREGTAPIPKLQPIFDKIARWMEKVYATIKGSAIDVEISEEVRAIFDRLASRLEQTLPPEMLGEDQNTDRKPPETPAVTEPEILLPPDAKPGDAAYGKTEAEMLGEDPPASEPNLDAPFDPDRSITALKNEQNDLERKRMGLDPLFTSARVSDPELWDRAVAAEDAYRGATSAGTELFRALSREPERVPNAKESALLLHEVVSRKNRYNKAMLALSHPPEGASQGDLADLRAALEAARSEFESLSNFIKSYGTEAARAFRFRQRFVSEDYDLVSVVTRLQAAKNKASDEPVPWTDADQKRAEEISEKLLAAQQALVAATEEKLDALLAVESLTQEVARMRKEVSRKNSALQTQVRDRLKPRVDAARARLLERGYLKEGASPDVLFQDGPSPQLAQDIADMGVVTADWLLEKLVDAETFTKRLIKTFGEKVRPYSKQIYAAAMKASGEVIREVNSDGITADDVVAAMDTDEDPTQKDIVDLAKLYILEGKEGTDVIDAVHAKLQEKFPDITRDRVAELFTRYGQVRREPSELVRIVSKIKTLERLDLQLRDLTEGQLPKKTGFQRDDPGPELRGKEKQVREGIRKLEDELRAKGEDIPGDADRRRTQLEAKERRIQNEIEEIQLALDSGKARVRPERRGSPTSETTEELQRRLSDLRKQEKVKFPKEDSEEARTARRENQLQALRAKYLLRIREKDFGPKEKPHPVDSKTIRDLEYELGQVKEVFHDLEAKFVHDNSPWLAKTFQRTAFTAAWLKSSLLGGDLGLVFRQAKYTYGAITELVLAKIPAKRFDRLRENPKLLVEAVKAGLRTMLDPKYEIEHFRKIQSRPMARQDRLLEIKYSEPFSRDLAAGEDLPVTNVMEKTPWWIYPAITGAMFSAAFFVPGAAMAMGLSAPIVIGRLGLSVFQKRYMLALDRMQRVMVNQMRASLVDASVASLPGNTLSRNDAKALGAYIMISTGRGVTRGHKSEMFIRALQPLLTAPRYYLSAIQGIGGYSLWSHKASSRGAKITPAARNFIAAGYAKINSSRAVILSLAALIYGVVLDDDDEDKRGLILDRFSRDYGSIRFNKHLKIDVFSGSRQYITAVLAAVGGARRETVSPGSSRQRIAVLTPQERSQVVTRFIGNKTHIGLKFPYNTLMGEYYGGKPVNPATMLDEFGSLVMLDDMMHIYESTENPEEAAMAASFLFLGGGVQAGDYKKEKVMWDRFVQEEKRERKAREIKLNR